MVEVRETKWSIGFDNVFSGFMVRVVMGLEAEQPIMFLPSSFLSVNGGGGGPLT